MALEQIEESPDLVVLLREAVTFYISYLETCMTKNKEVISEFDKAAEQVAQRIERRDLVTHELEALRAQKHEVESDLGELMPYLSLVDKVESIKGEISERRRQLWTKEEETMKKKQTALRQPDDTRLASISERAAALFHGEKICAEFIIGRLTENLASFKKRLSDAKIDEEWLRTREKDARARAGKITDAILAKEKIIANIDKFLQGHDSKSDYLEELKWEFGRCETDYNNLLKLIEILSEVPANGTIVPATEKAVSA